MLRFCRCVLFPPPSIQLHFTFFFSPRSLGLTRLRGLGLRVCNGPFHHALCQHWALPRSPLTPPCAEGVWSLLYKRSPEGPMTWPQNRVRTEVGSPEGKRSFRLRPPEKPFGNPTPDLAVMSCVLVPQVSALQSTV